MNYRRLDEIANAAAAAAAAASIIALLATCSGTTTTCAEDGYRAEATVYETYIYKYEEADTESETAIETAPETEQMCTDYVSAWVETVSEVSEPEAAAVAYTDDEVLLMRIAYAEAGNQGVEGQALVMRVVLNRIADGTFPNTVYDVIFQPEQFAGAYADAFNIAEIPDDTRQALELVKNGWDGSQGALYFCRPYEGGWHDLNLIELFTYGDHVFYK